MGLHAVQLARLIGAFVMAVDVGAHKLQAARECGADASVDTREDDFVQIALDWTNGESLEQAEAVHQELREGRIAGRAVLQPSTGT